MTRPKPDARLIFIYRWYSCRLKCIECFEDRARGAQYSYIRVILGATETRRMSLEDSRTATAVAAMFESQLWAKTFADKGPSHTECECSECCQLYGWGQCVGGLVLKREVWGFHHTTCETGKYVVDMKQ